MLRSSGHDTTVHLLPITNCQSSIPGTNRIIWTVAKGTASLGVVLTDEAKIACVSNWGGKVALAGDSPEQWRGDNSDRVSLSIMSIMLNFGDAKPYETQPLHRNNHR
jgi:hypothetical protein